MKYLPGFRKETPDRSLTFQLDAREEALLLAILHLYPVLEASHYRLSKDPNLVAASEQQLLEESISQQRMAHRKKLEELFRNPARYFKEAAGERRLVLSGAQLEWLLQVLNDIRVGSWVKLGCPDLENQGAEASHKMNPRDVQAMHLSGHFQSALLEACK